MRTQDVSKKGLKYGDENEHETEKKELEAQKIAFKPLVDWLKKDLKGQISDGKYMALSRPSFVADRFTQLSSPTAWSPPPVLSLWTTWAGLPTCSELWLLKQTLMTILCSKL